MKKYLISFISVIMLLSLCTFGANAADKEKTYTSGDYKYTVLKDGTLEIDKYIGKGKADVVIPSKIGGKKVTAVGEKAFRYNDSIKKLTIPGTVKVIGKYAFANVHNLEKVVIKKGTETIKNGAFQECYELKSVVISESVTTFGDLVFFDCTSLNDITVGNKIKKIGNGVLSSTKYASEPGNREKGVLYFGNCLMSCSKEATGEIKIKDKTTLIAQNAFAGCDKITGVVIPASLKKIDRYTFADCDSLSKVTLKNGVESIGEKAFINCPVKTVTIPKSVKEIGDYAIGYKSPDNAKKSPIKVKGVKIKAYAGTAGEEYAKEYGVSLSYLTPSVPKVKISAGEDSIKVKYTKATGATGFQVRYTLGKKSVTKTYSTTKSVTKTISKLKEGTYKVKVRSFVKSGDKKIYSKWTDSKTVIVCQNHKTKTVKAKSATYFSAGWNKYKKCTVCDKKIGYTEISKKKLERPSGSKITAGNDKIKVNYKAVKDATGFQVKYVSGEKTVTKTYDSKKSVTKTIKSLNEGKYKVYVRAVVEKGNTKAYSSWTKAKTVTVK